MNSEAFAQVEQLYQTLLALEPEQRNARLAALSDARLRHEVERLLQANEQATAFLQAPRAVVPDVLDTMPRLRALGHYRLRALLGKGGMGEVYLAEDTQLERQVALKLLPATFTGEADRVRRFAREAKAASALNHPNILTIHEIGHEQNTHFIATEYIAGTTLRQRLSETRLPLRTVLDIAAQIASALVAAHAAGIIHRDIKPENVMLREDGLVKVLDFGLAKLAEARKSERGTGNEEAATLLQDDAESQHSSFRDHHSTEPGTVMGTASYMSPEQARGQEVDARSDIFSLGVMLYEMLAGRAPFAGVNPIDVLGAILHQDPVPLHQVVTNLPAELQRIVNKALRKDRDERYQHSKELWLDLNDLRREWEFEEKLKARQLSSSEVGEQASPEVTTTSGAQPTAGAVTQPTVSSAEYLISEIKQHKKSVAIGVVTLLACLTLLAYGVYRWASVKPIAVPFQNVKLTRLTSVGNVKPVSVSVSPDGKFIAYVQMETGQNSLWTKAVATGSAVQIVPPTEADLRNTTFSSDGNYVYYQRQDGQTTLYQIPVLGGTLKKVLTGINSRITFSPDGKQFAFTRGSADQTKSQLIVMNADGSSERVLAERQLRDPFSASSWSPDGKIIAAVASSIEGELRKTVLLSVAVGSGEVQPLVQVKDNLRNFNNVQWFKDGMGLALIAGEQGGSAGYQIWYVSYPGGEVRRITNDLANYPSLSLTADNSALVTDQSQSYSNLWLMPLSASGRAQQITRGDNREGMTGLRWAPEGRIVYTSHASGNLDVWLMNADGSNARQLTNDAAFDYLPVVSPDGRYLVFASNRSGKADLWRTDLDGGNPKQLTTGETNTWFDISPDSRWVVFLSSESGNLKLHKVSLEGGSPVLLNDGRFTRPAISPDGKLIACLSQSAHPNVVILPFEGGAAIKTLEGKFTVGIASPLRWTPDSRALLYISTTNLWRLPLDGSPPQPVTHFNDDKPERIWNFDLSRDGKQLVIARGGQNADVVMISEVK